MRDIYFKTFWEKGAAIFIQLLTVLFTPRGVLDAFSPIPFKITIFPRKRKTFLVSSVDSVTKSEMDQLRSAKEELIFWNSCCVSKRAQKLSPKWCYLYIFLETHVAKCISRHVANEKTVPLTQKMLRSPDNFVIDTLDKSMVKCALWQLNKILCQDKKSADDCSQNYECFICKLCLMCRK